MELCFHREERIIMSKTNGEFNSNISLNNTTESDASVIVINENNINEITRPVYHKGAMGLPEISNVMKKIIVEPGKNYYIEHTLELTYSLLFITEVDGGECTLTINNTTPPCIINQRSIIDYSEASADLIGDVHSHSEQNLNL